MTAKKINQPALMPDRPSRAHTATELLWAITLTGGVHLHQSSRKRPPRWYLTSSITRHCFTASCARIPIAAMPRNGRHQ